MQPEPNRRIHEKQNLYGKMKNYIEKRRFIYGECRFFAHTNIKIENTHVLNAYYASLKCFYVFRFLLACLFWLIFLLFSFCTRLSISLSRTFTLSNLRYKLWAIISIKCASYTISLSHVCRSQFTVLNILYRKFFVHCALQANLIKEKSGVRQQ